MSSEYVTPIISQKIGGTQSVISQPLPIYRRLFLKTRKTYLVEPSKTSLTVSTIPVTTTYVNNTQPVLPKLSENFYETSANVSRCQEWCNSVPWWCWLLGLLLPLALLGTLIFFMVTSPCEYFFRVINPANALIRYLYGTNYSSSVFNRTEIYYVPKPCFPTSLLPGYINTTPFPLCNETSSNYTLIQSNKETSRIETPVSNSIIFKNSNITFLALYLIAILKFTKY